MRQTASLPGVSKSAADRIVDHNGPLPALPLRRRFARGTVLIADGTLVPTRDHAVAEQAKNHRYFTDHQVVIDAGTRPVVVVGRTLPGNRDDRRAGEEPGAEAAVGRTTVRADGGCPGTGSIMPHRRTRGEELPGWKRKHNRSRKQVGARVERVPARTKTWKTPCDCRLEGGGVHHAVRGVARLRDLILAGQCHGRSQTGASPASAGGGRRVPRPLRAHLFHHSGPERFQEDASGIRPKRSVLPAVVARPVAHHAPLRAGEEGRIPSDELPVEAALGRARDGESGVCLASGMTVRALRTSSARRVGNAATRASATFGGFRGSCMTGG